MRRPSAHHHIVEEHEGRRVLVVAERDGTTHNDLARLPKPARIRALREMADDPSIAPAGVFVVVVSRCMRCGEMARWCEQTQAVDQPDEACIAGTAHEWRYHGRSVVAGKAPWLAQVPGQRRPGLHALRAGERVHIGARVFVAPEDAVFALHEDRDAVRVDDFRPTGDGGFVRTTPIVRLEPSSRVPSKSARKAERERQKQAIKAARARKQQG